MGKIILDEMAMNRTLKRISHEIIENVTDLSEVVIVGIKTRGEYLGERIVANIMEFENVKIQFTTIDITHFRDDNSSRHEMKVDVEGLDIDVTDKVVILVDDVLFTGRTIRSAMDAIVFNGRPKAIKLAVLVDRGHRELPISADFVGKNIPTSMQEDVNVYVKEIDHKEYIEIN